MIPLIPQRRKQYAEKNTTNDVGCIVKPFAAIRHVDPPTMEPQVSKASAGKQVATQQKGYRIPKRDATPAPHYFACCGEEKPRHAPPGADPHWHTCTTCGLPVHNTILCDKVISPSEGVLFCSKTCLFPQREGIPPPTEANAERTITSCPTPGTSASMPKPVSEEASDMEQEVSVDHCWSHGQKEPHERPSSDPGNQREF